MAAPPTPVPIEVLLEHRAWVHRVARALVADDATGDDLEQEAWVRAHTKPPRHGGALKAWLGTVLRRAASDARRSERRRKRREVAAARPERQRSTLDLVTEAEALKRVVTALLDLEEPYRTAIFLRYFDGMTPPQIAERTGVPLETARTRLKRGLDRLRERFDRESGGRRATWMLVLLPLAERAAPEPKLPVRGVSGIGTTLGALIMTMQTKSGLAVVALALLALGAFVGMRPEPDDTPAELASTAPPPGLAQAPGLRPAPARGGPAVKAGTAPDRVADAGGDTAPLSPSGGACGVLLEVLDEHGAHVRSGTVTLASGGGSSIVRLLKRAELTRRMAEEPARFRWLLDPVDLEKGNPAEVGEIPAEFEGLELEARAEVPPYAPVVAVLPPLVAGKLVGARWNVVPGRRVDFVVRAATDGRPVSNARIVSLTEISRRGVSPEDVAAPDGAGWATTGADGCATVAELGPGPHDVEILAEGYRPGRFDAAVLDGEPVVVRLDVSHDDAVLEVVVRDPVGGPVAGQRVLLNTRLRLTPLALATDASGIARFERLPPGIQTLRLESRSWVLRARDAQWPGGPRCTTFAYVEDLPPGGTRTISLGYLPTGGEMTFDVVDPAGAPLAGVGVRFVGMLSPHGTTDARGRVEFPELAPGRYRPQLLPRGGDEWLCPERDLRDGETLAVRCVLGRHSISGVVRAGSEGHPPILGASVYADGDLGAGAASGPDGSYVIRSAAPGRYRIEASSVGFANVGVTVDVPGDADAIAPVILLVRGGRILLRAAPADRDALGAARLRLVDPERREVPLGQDVSGGEDFRRTHLLAPGRYVLEIGSAGRAVAGRAIDVEDGKDSIVLLSAP